MKKILTLGPNTFLWVNKENGLVYNSKNYKAYEFKLTPEISKLCDTILDYDHLYSLEYDESSDSSISGFIEGILSIEAGCVHDRSQSVMSLPPLLKIQHEMDFLKKRDNEFQDFALRHLSKVVIFVGGKCQENIFYQQTTYPVNHRAILQCQEIINFLKSITSPYISEISIVFSDIMRYDDLIRLSNFWGSLKSHVTICVRSDEAFIPIKEMLECGSNINIKLLYTSNKLYHPNKYCETNKLIHTFLISSEKDYIEFDKIFNNNINDIIEGIPVFDSDNFEFIKHNVFLSKNEILSSELTRRDIFIHRVLNTNFFGTLYIMPDGNVYSELLSPSLGSINDSIYDLILKEISLNYSWRKVRNTGKCQSCLYRELCPSPSIYEKLMKTECICIDK